jgi:hypothetical protein
MYSYGVYMLVDGFLFVKMLYESVVSRMPLMFILGAHGYILLNLCLEPCSFHLGSKIQLSSWMFGLHATLWRSLSLFLVAKALQVPCLFCKSWTWYVRCLCLKNLLLCHKCLYSLSWVLNRCMMFTNVKSHIQKWTHGSVALTWHEIACRRLGWSCDDDVWPCIKFVGYMLFVLILTMCRSYVHERKFLCKILHLDHGYVTCLYVPIYLVGDACAQSVAILLVYVSIFSML